MSNNSRNTVISHGWGLGSIIAVTASWGLHQSVLWAILHGVLGWFYVIYYVIFH